MKKLIVFILASALLFSCSEKPTTIKINLDSTRILISPKSNSADLLRETDCADKGTPYANAVVCGKDYLVAIYNDGVPIENSKLLTQWHDSSYVKFYNGIIYLDSLKGTNTINSSNMIATIDSANGLLGKRKFSSLFTGTSSQYIKGDGTYATLPSAYSFTGTTKQLTLGNGTYRADDYYNSATTTSGVATFYLTSDKTSSGTALYTTIDFVAPIINDASNNYTYGWSYNSGTKALSVTYKQNGTALLSLINVLTGPANVPNGTTGYVFVKGH